VARRSPREPAANECRLRRSATGYLIRHSTFSNAPDTELEDQLFAVCTMISVEPLKSERALNVLRHALGGQRCEYVLALLAFIKTAHFWTLTHPGIQIEDDVKQLMNEHKELAALLLQGPDLWSA
jgi:hypothetical protein